MGYHSFIFTRDEVKPVESREKDEANFSLSDEDKKMLKEIAYDAIRMTLRVGVINFPAICRKNLRPYVELLYLCISTAG